MEATEMRAHARVPVCCAADIFHTGANEPEHGFITDLSEGGAFVQTKRPLRRGDRLFLRVALDDEAVAGVATEVTWVKKFEPISVDGRLPGVGVRFLDLAPPERSRIRLYLREQQKNAEQPSLAPQQAESWPVLPRDETWNSLAGEEQLLNSSDLQVVEPKVVFHDTDVDGYDVAATDPPAGMARPEQYEMDEPELGDPVFDEDVLLSVPPRRAPRSPTIYFALGSLCLGVIAGAVYGALAPNPTASATARRTPAPAATTTRIALTAATAAPSASAAPAAAEPAKAVAAPAVAGTTLGDDDEIPGVTRTEPAAGETPEAVAAAEPAASEGAPPPTEEVPPLAPIAAKPEPTVARTAPPAKAEPAAEKPESLKIASETPLTKPIAAIPPATAKGAISISKPRQFAHGWQIAIKGGAVATKKFALQSPARAVVDVPAALAAGVEARDLGAGPFERVRLGKQGDQARLVLDLRGVVSTSQIRFTEKGSDLVIEVPAQALAHR